MFGCCCGGMDHRAMWRATGWAMVWSIIAGAIVALRVWLRDGSTDEMTSQGFTAFSMLIGPVWAGFAIGGSRRRACGRGSDGPSSGSNPATPSPLDA